MKRGIGGVYHQVSQKYLQTYLDEYSFRYNRRDRGNLVFASTLERVSSGRPNSPLLHPVGVAEGKRLLARLTLCILGGRFGVIRRKRDGQHSLEASVAQLCLKVNH